MKKILILCMAIACAMGVSSCGNKEPVSSTVTETSNSSLDLTKETEAEPTEAETSNGSLDLSTDSETEPDDADNAAGEDIIPSVMVDGKVYQDTGYISSAGGCGNMDGEITSTVDGSEMPSKDDQSNFGKDMAINTVEKIRFLCRLTARWKYSATLILTMIPFLCRSHAS